MSKWLNSVTHRQDFVLLFDVLNGNPNGDPDAGNLPRVDPETMHGLVTDVALKRKVRNYIDLKYGSEESMKIYVQNKGIALNELHTRAYTALGLKQDKAKAGDIERTRQWMCENFYDIRTFGAVMTMKVNCGQVRGPVQMTFSRSIDPIVPLDVSITRVAVTKAEDMVKVDGDDESAGKRTEMGRKAIVPYGLYMGYGFVTPAFAEQTGFSDNDLARFWEAMVNMFETDHSAARGLMSVRGLYVFSHESPLGNAPAHSLFDRITISRKPEVAVSRSYSDYIVNINTEGLPETVELNPLVG